MSLLYSYSIVLVLFLAVSFNPLSFSSTVKQADLQDVSAPLAEASTSSSVVLDAPEASLTKADAPEQAPQVFDLSYFMEQSSYVEYEVLIPAEVACLAEAVYFEARGEPVKRYVIDTVFNRVESKYFPNNVCEVINQPYQFSYTLDKNRVIDDFDSYQKSVEIAKAMFKDYQSGSYVDVTKGALYYFNPDKVASTPAWVDEKYYLFTSAGHKFYRWHKLG